MHSTTRAEGNYRIHAMAIGGEFGDGYVAAVAICQAERGQSWRVAFRSEALAGGYHWPTAQAALCFALGKGRELVASDERHHRAQAAPVISASDPALFAHAPRFPARS